MERLSAAGQTLTADNPVLASTLDAFEDAVRRQRALIDANATTMQQQGATAAATLTRELALPGLSDQALATLGIRWNVPDPEAVARLVDYASSEAWTAELDRYERGATDTVRRIAVRGIIEGKNPVAIAREIRQAVATIPAAQANNLMRTLQLTAYRDATAIHQAANADIISAVIRIATLDTRTCLGCIVLHGTTVPVGERVDDHHRGRCVGVAQVRGRALNVRSGEEWLNAQPEARQVEIMGAAAFNAWRAGDVRLRDFAQTYADPVFGTMVREASLKGLLGDQARQYYRRRD